MERLTKKVSKTVQDKYSLGSYLHYDFANVDDTNKLLNKLGVIEDFMEEQGFESLEDLKNIISNIEKLMIISSKITYVEQENQALKDRWQKLKEFVKEKGNHYFKKGHFFEIEDDYAEVLFKMEELEKE